MYAVRLAPFPYDFAFHHLLGGKKTDVLFKKQSKVRQTRGLPIQILLEKNARIKTIQSKGLPPKSATRAPHFETKEHGTLVDENASGICICPPRTVRNCLIRPFFFGPRQMTALSCCGSINPIDMTPRPSVTHTGDHPDELWCTSRPVRPSMRGTLGPQMSTSRSPT